MKTISIIMHYCNKYKATIIVVLAFLLILFVLDNILKDKENTNLQKELFRVQAHTLDYR